MKHFHNMQIEERNEVLEYMYNYMNNRFFDGVLDKISVFQGAGFEVDGILGTYSPTEKRISIDTHSITKFRGKMDASRLYFEMASVMLHEMIHQYCDQFEIDDSNHNENFMKTAEDFGLLSRYINGEHISEELELYAENRIKRLLEKMETEFPGESIAE